jgi:hypothetical protein
MFSWWNVVQRLNKKYSQMKVIMLKQQDALTHVKSILPQISSVRKAMQIQWTSLVKDYSAFREEISRELVEVRMRIHEKIEEFVDASDAHELQAFAKRVVCSAGLQVSNTLLLEMVCVESLESNAIECNSLNDQIFFCESYLHLFCSFRARKWTP